MRLSPATLTAALLTAFTTVVAIWAWTRLPPGAGVPMHYLGLDGVPHTGASRALLWVMPFASALVTLALTGVGRRPSLAASAALPLDITMIAVVGVLMVTQFALVGRAADPAFNVLRPVGAATGVLLVAVGNYLGKARRNAVFGLRTPWTLADETVWDRTHRFTGLGMVVGGLLLIVLSLLLRDATAIGLAIAACSALPPLAGILRSASLHRDLQRG
jgi:uncharacterized membrane protein